MSKFCAYFLENFLNTARYSNTAPLECEARGDFEMRQNQFMNRKACRQRMCLITLGITLLLVFTQLGADTGQQPEAKPIESQQPPETAVWIQDPYTGDSVLTLVREVDTSLWNAARIEDYEESTKVDAEPPLGILTIRKVNIQVPIYNGTDEFNLNRGAGRIKGMARMDEIGNLGISGHRDGFFRGLKDIQLGDDILIQTTRGVRKYAVSSIDIVPKDDISVLAPTTDMTLTIVTCYPFYFVGNAPKRYIVKATPNPTWPEG